MNRTLLYSLKPLIKDKSLSTSLMTLSKKIVLSNTFELGFPNFLN
jgi:hypothetical protein